MTKENAYSLSILYFIASSSSFNGYVSGDSGAVNDISSSHFYSPNASAGAVAAISAGCDVQSAGWKAGQPWNTSGAYITDLPAEVRAGRLNESV